MAATKLTTMRLDEEVRAILAELGDGDMTEGVRRLIDPQTRDALTVWRWLEPQTHNVSITGTITINMSELGAVLAKGVANG